MRGGALRPAHPRSRGEHLLERARSREKPGSSPLTRGALRGHETHPRSSRLIPAHAGSTIFTASSACGSPAHPRSRGEHLVVPVGVIPLAGSSPLTRGARRRGRPRAGAGRLIPAHAGSTRLPRARPHRLRAHPRSRGEHQIASAADVNANGSSPLTRGAH